jgi:hypothetical protein
MVIADRHAGAYSRHIELHYSSHERALIDFSSSYLA